MTTETPAEFIEYMKRNYPPNTIISDPEWHASRIFRAAAHAILNVPLKKDLDNLPLCQCPDGGKPCGSYNGLFCTICNRYYSDEARGYKDRIVPISSVRRPEQDNG